MKEHPGTSFVSAVEILQPDVASFYWRILTVDEAAGRLHSVTEGRERHLTREAAWSAANAALSQLEFA